MDYLSYEKTLSSNIDITLLTKNEKDLMYNVAKMNSQTRHKRMMPEVYNRG